MGNEYIYELADYAVIVGKSQSPDNKDNNVFQIINKEYGVVEFETREIGQAKFRCHVVQRMHDTGEWEKQWANFLSSQEIADRMVAADDSDPDVAEVADGEKLPGEAPVKGGKKKSPLKSVN